MPRLVPQVHTYNPSEYVLGEDGTYRRNGYHDGRDEDAAHRFGGGYRLRTRRLNEGTTQEVEIREMVMLAAGGSTPSSITPVGQDRETARSAGDDREKILEKCYELYVSDPLAGQIAETTKNFVFGSGCSVTFVDDKANAWAKRFRVRNEMDVLEKALGAMSVYQGDIYLWLRPVQEDLEAGRRRIEIAGDTRLTVIDPQNIVGIETMPDDPRDVLFYHFSYMDPDKQTKVQLKIRPHDKYDPEKDAKRGCVIQIKFNSDPNDPFGNPDFLRIGEWLENYKEYLRDGVIINKLYRSPCYDITLSDADAPDVQLAIARYKNWKIGSNAVHNDKEKWETMEFAGPNSSQSEARRAILLMIAAGVGFAEYMLADGSNANLASTTTQELPVLKKFEDRQSAFKCAFWYVYQIVLMHAAVYGDLPESFDEFKADYYWEGTIDFPSLVKSTEKETEETNASATSGGYMSKTTAAGRLGLNYADEVRRMMKDSVLAATAEKAMMDERKKQGLDDINPDGTPKEPKPVPAKGNLAGQGGSKAAA